MAKIVTIQNVDRIVRQKEYPTDGLLVTSIFRTVQGEGPYAGWPSIFLRLAGCNFGDKSDHCQFCDTSFRFDQGKFYTFEDLCMTLMAQPGYNEKDILVITGGEPTLQPALLSFIQGIDFFARVQIETNGTQVSFFKQLEELEDSEDLPAVYVRPSVVVSPKASSKAGRYAELSKTVLGGTSCLKFVVTADPDDPHHEVPQWAFESKVPIYVSPMAVYKKPYSGEVSSAWDHDLIDPVETSKNYAYAAQYALKHNLKLSIQQHLFLGVA